MVSEYSADIFEYLGELEVSFSYGEYQRLIICQNFTLPMHNYIQHQPEITWKYEETHVPSIGHFVNMTDYSYSKGILSRAICLEKARFQFVELLALPLDPKN